MIVAEQAGISLGGRQVVREVTLSLSAGDFVGLAGPNGAGKSTLLRALAGLVAVKSGRIMAGGREIAAMAPGERARQIAWLGQTRPVAWDMAVEDIAALGRHGLSAAPYARMAHVHKAAVDLALAKAGASAFCGRRFNALSGGEQARVHLARLLASPASFLLLDEPCAALDIAHQLSLMETLCAEAEDGRCVVVVLHDLDLMARTFPRTILLDHGSLVADGPSTSVLDNHNLASIFGVKRAPDGHFARV